MIINSRNQEIAELKIKVSDLEDRIRQIIKESSPSKFESRIDLLEDEIQTLNR